MQILNPIENWRSIRRYEQKEVEKEKINAILEAGRMAPSWQNLQPWHFLVITEDSGKNKLAEIVTTVKLVQKAPVVIVVLGDMNGFQRDEAVRLLMEQLGERMSEEDLRKYLDRKITSPLNVGIETVKARVLEQLSYAAAFMALEASNQGLGACVLGGIENNITEETDKCREVKEYFGIPKNYEIYTLITLGYPNEKPAKRSRKNLEEVSSWEKF
ncbi:NADH dehydrogenase [Clostridium homopropionicum DSM 5847]|uniref:NADH dehydrogenase n=1 Tax=Clostridium homopropionicum DSM 5847 TaxID=1121318 RepID=A0A0L6ZC89_9CLOT|nr:nitroreductase family protein [Clostridium homopropionicum]KOA20413.1 NADH dehydrogenase [Clostridium homopropionicum DSM 5847]SFG34108.1 Nitroreductase [Clostridium homopropionicum]